MQNNAFFYSNKKYSHIPQINTLEPSIKELELLYQNHPAKSFVSVFKGTKGGDFRGALDYEHDVDVSLKCEKGKATAQKNRFVNCN